MSTPINTILSWFETGDFPTQEQFAASWTSFYHKDEGIPMNSVTGLSAAFQNTVSTSTFSAHLSDENAHNTTLAKLDATNLTQSNIDAWKTILEVGQLPPNIATVDDGSNVGNVYTKEQTGDLFLKNEDYVNDGKIRADKIEALAMTDLIVAVETTIEQFAANNADYTFQKNDFIAIPDQSGKYSLYMFKGDLKNVSGNYLPTGLTSITISQVEGLQAELNKKQNAPTTDGTFLAKRNAGVNSWLAVNPTASYLLYYNNGNFQPSSVFTDGTKYGFGTTTPTEMLHLNNGRVRSKAIVLDENTEALPFQITYSNRRFYGADLTGEKRMLMYRDYADYLALVQSFTNAQKEALGTAWNNQYSNGALNVYSITPTVMKNDHVVRYLVLQGINLNVNPSTTSIKFIPVGNAIGVGEIDCLGFQTVADGRSMVVSVYGDTLPPATQYNLVIRTTTPTVQTHRTNNSINVVTDIDNIDLSGLNWDNKAYTQSTANSIFVMNGGLFSYSADPANKAYAFDPSTIIAASKSDTIFNAGTNFYLEMNFSLTNTGSNLNSDVNDYYGYFGLIQSSIPNVLLNNTFLRMIFSSFRSGTYSTVFVYNNSLNNENRIEPNVNIANGNIVIMRQGNIYTQFITVGSRTIINTMVGTTEAVSLSMTVTNGTTQKKINGSIVQAFTF